MITIFSCKKMCLALCTFWLSLIAKTAWNPSKSLKELFLWMKHISSPDDMACFLVVCEFWEKYTVYTVDINNTYLIIVIFTAQNTSIFLSDPWKACSFSGERIRKKLNLTSVQERKKYLHNFSVNPGKWLDTKCLWLSQITMGGTGH